MTDRNRSGRSGLAASFAAFLMGVAACLAWCTEALGQAPGPVAGHPNFAGIWQLNRQRGVKKVSPPDLPEGWRTFGTPDLPGPPLTRQAYEAVKAQRVKESQATNKQGGLDDQTARCARGGFPDFISFGDPLDIMQRPDEIIMVTERERQIPRHIWISPPHPLLPDYSPARSGLLFNNGHSVAHWEGDTLVIESDSFDPGPWMFSIERLPHSDAMTTTERLSLSADGATLTDLLEIRDPKVLTAPWKLKFSWHRAPPGTEALEGNCDIDLDYLGVNGK